MLSKDQWLIRKNHNPHMYVLWMKHYEAQTEKRSDDYELHRGTKCGLWKKRMSPRGFSGTFRWPINQPRYLAQNRQKFRDNDVRRFSTDCRCRLHEKCIFAREKRIFFSNVKFNIMSSISIGFVVLISTQKYPCIVMLLIKNSRACYRVLQRVGMDCRLYGACTLYL